MSLIGTFKKVLRNALCENKEIGSRTEADSFEAEAFFNCNKRRLFSDDRYDLGNPNNAYRISHHFDFMFCNIHYRGPDKK